MWFCGDYELTGDKGQAFNALLLLFETSVITPGYNLGSMFKLFAVFLG
jgi:hypothetical protein